MFVSESVPPILGGGMSPVTPFCYGPDSDGIKLHFNFRKNDKALGWSTFGRPAAFDWRGKQHWKICIRQKKSLFNIFLKRQIDVHFYIMQLIFSNFATDYFKKSKIDRFKVKTTSFEHNKNLDIWNYKSNQIKKSNNRKVYIIRLQRYQN